MIVGHPRIGAAPVELDADQVSVIQISSEVPLQVSHLAAYLDGEGSNDGAALIRPVIYDADDNLLAVGDELVVASADVAGWRQFTFSADPGRSLPAGEYAIGLHVGGVTDCARIWVDDPGPGGSRRAADTYADGAAAVLPAPAAETASLPLFLSAFPAWQPPDVDDESLSRLSWGLAQRALGAAGTVRHSRVSARAGWHGTTFDEETGAAAVVRSDGPLAELVGERIRVTRRTGAGDRSAVVVVTNELAFPDEVADEDLSLSARAFLALAPWSADVVPVIVEVLA